jgi:hypothetical protein
MTDHVVLKELTVKQAMDQMDQIKMNDSAGWSY